MTIINLSEVHAAHDDARETDYFAVCRWLSWKNGESTCPDCDNDECDGECRSHELPEDFHN